MYRFMGIHSWPLIQMVICWHWGEFLPIFVNGLSIQVLARLFLTEWHVSSAHILDKMVWIDIFVYCFVISLNHSLQFSIYKWRKSPGAKLVMQLPVYMRWYSHRTCRSIRILCNIRTFLSHTKLHLILPQQLRCDM